MSAKLQVACLIKSIDHNNVYDIIGVFYPGRFLFFQDSSLPASLLLVNPSSSQNTYLTHLPQDKMAAISQIVFSDAFSWMKNFVFWLRFHWSLFLRFQLAITQHLVQIMAWCRPGDKTLSEPTLVTHIYVTWPQLVNNMSCTYMILNDFTNVIDHIPQICKQLPCGYWQPICLRWKLYAYHVMSLAPGRCGSNSKSVIFEHMLLIKFVSTSCEISLRWMPQNAFEDNSPLVEEGNGLVPSGNKPLHQPMLTQISVSIWYH